MSKTRFLGAATVAAALFGALALAQIRSTTLSEMLTELDAKAVYGEITDSTVFRINDPVDGAELYFTTLTIEGRGVGDGTPLTVEVNFAGGFINETEGVYNSEAPAADAVKVGRRVVAFYKFQENAPHRGNSAPCGHGAFFQTMEGPKGTVVQGRGEGFAISQNMKIGALDAAVQEIRKSDQPR